MPITPEAALAQALAPLLDTTGHPLLRVGVAVSGGGDSLALLHLTHAWARAHGIEVLAATVDHGLRPEAAVEAAAVAATCADLGIGHVTLPWQDWDQRGNLQAKARAARRRLLQGWADSAGLRAVLLGHTADDQAETFLMRLARGSGVDGLSGMAVCDGLFLRPLLGVGRGALRDWLTERRIVWIDDPSNDDLRFDRVKARQALATLAPLGLTVDRLNDTSAHMLRARRSLWQAAGSWAHRFVQTDQGDLIFAPEALHLGHSDVEQRVFAAALQWIGGADYRPRYESLLDAAEGLRRGETRTLGGVLMHPDEKNGARLTREVAATEAGVAARGAGVTPWDHRWLMSRSVSAEGLAATSPALHVAALGEAGLLQCNTWREAGLPRASLLSSPAVWSADTLIAAPLAGFSNGWQAKLSPTFASFILSH